MKKLLYLLLLTPIIYLASCSSGKGDLSPEPLPIQETIVGVTWQLLNVGGGWFRLNDDYTYSTKDYLCDTFAIEGTWSLDGDIISNTYFIGAAQFVERSTIIQYSDSLLKFQADTTPTADVYIWFEACVPEPTRGCMDSTFLNFNPNAQCPDTCMNDPVYGCMDVDALNYDVTANIDDGSCCYVEGCMDATALNYNANACQDDGSCCYIEGCMDATALNYNANACQDDGSCTYLAIGDTYQGGIIFYLDGNGGGLIAGNYTPTETYWGCYVTVNSITGADGTAIGTGAQNTIDIEAGCTTIGTAADICANLTSNGYSDWFLPSKDELNEMYLNLHQQGLGSFTNNNYWSSSEAINNGNDIIGNEAYFQSFSNGIQSFDSKNQIKSVRAVRAF